MIHGTNRTESLRLQGGMKGPPEWLGIIIGKDPATPQEGEPLKSKGILVTQSYQQPNLGGLLPSLFFTIRTVHRSSAQPTHPSCCCFAKHLYCFLLQSWGASMALRGFVKSRSQLISSKPKDPSSRRNNEVDRFWALSPSSNCK